MHLLIQVLILESINSKVQHVASGHGAQAVPTVDAESAGWRARPQPDRTGRRATFENTFGEAV